MMDGSIRKAASLVVARAEQDGIEVLVLERSPSSRFLPGYVAFPGGANDEGDGELAERWFGSRTEIARACAVRELAEEVGLALTADGLSAAEGDGLAALSAAPPARDQLRPLARWIAPERVPVRFDARYFTVVTADRIEPRPDGRETAIAWWASPGELLEQWAIGTRKLYWPTYFTIEAIARCRSLDELLRLRIDTREPDDHELERLPRSTFWQD